VKKFIVIAMVAIIGLGLFSQPVMGNPEKLANIPLGSEELQVTYSLDDEGFFSPGSPYVDSLGRVLFGSKRNNSRVLMLVGGDWQSVDPNNTKKPPQMISSIIASQQGMGIVSSIQYVTKGDKYITYDFDTKENTFDADSETMNTPTPFGAILFSDKSKTGIAVVFDVKNPQNDFYIIDQDHIKAWLSAQPGGFSIGSDGFLYHNNTLWSVVRPTDSTGGTRFIGRLMSGHLVWMGQEIDQERYIVISNTKGKTEIIVELPWGANDNSNSTYLYKSGLGPWGELYCLLPPPFIITRETKNAEGHKTPVYEPDPKGKTELVVVRNYLKYFGRLNDSNVRLRKDPTTTADILGTYPAKTGFRILEKGMKEETIAGAKNVWYKVRLLDGKVGWFFGSFVANLYDGPNGKAPPWPNVPDW